MLEKWAMDGSSIKTLPNEFPDIQNICFEPPFSAFRPEDKTPFVGMLVILYKPDKLLLEFGSFHDWLKQRSAMEISIEGFTQLVFDVLKERLDPQYLHITFKSETQTLAAVSCQISYFSS
jgi:NADPH-dependent 7-cyano-7-deazaguanine reductase QueF